LPTVATLLGTTDGEANVAATGAPGSGALGQRSNAGSGLAAISIPALGAPSFGKLMPGSGLDVLAPALTLGYVIDAASVADQSPHVRELDAWDVTTGQLLSGFPTSMDDMQFFDQALVANVGGPGRPPYAVAGSALDDLRAVDASGQEAPGFPKFTGGWLVNSPVFGPFGELPDQVLAAGTRAGMLFVWRTRQPACAASGDWPMAHHDLGNTNDLATRWVPAPRCARPS
jgi:hypothetical protein